MRDDFLKPKSNSLKKRNCLEDVSEPGLVGKIVRTTVLFCKKRQLLW